MDVLLVYFLRRRILGLTAGENKALPELSRKIKDLEKADDKKTLLIQILSDQESTMRLPNDIELERELKVMNFFNLKNSKFLLALIEEKITKKRPDLDDEKLQIEHIMPQTLSQEWIVSLGDGCEDMHQQYVNTIGNLTLIRHNQELGNKPFDEKKAVYQNKTSIQIAKTEITDKQSWGRQEIEKRATWIIKFLLHDVLPIPDEMRHKNNFSATKKRKLSFIDLQLVGEDIRYVKDPTIKATVVTDREVSFEGKVWKLSPLTKEIETRRGTVTKSGAYQGAHFWEYQGIRLTDMM